MQCALWFSLVPEDMLSNLSGAKNQTASHTRWEKRGEQRSNARFAQLASLFNTKKKKKIGGKAWVSVADFAGEAFESDKKYECFVRTYTAARPPER